MTVARSLAALLASLVLWSLAPVVLGWEPSVVMSGSMRPAVSSGDVLVSRAVDPADLNVGQVLVVADPDHEGRLRSHRLEKIKADGTLVLRGDANATRDSSPVDVTDVHGVAVLRVPYVGLPAVWASARDWGSLGATVAATLLIGYAATRGPAGGAPPRRGGRTRSASVAAGLAIAAVATTATGGAADAAFRKTAVNPTNTLNAAASYYPYRDAVRADSPSLYWRLAETSGTVAADTSGNARPGTYTNISMFSQIGPIIPETRDRAVATGTNGYVTATAIDTGPTTYSIEAWFKTTSAGGGRIIGYGSSPAGTTSMTTDRQVYMSPAGRLVFGQGMLKTTITTAAAYNNGGWHHVVATYSLGTGMRMYVDGVLAASLTVGAPVPVSLNGYWRAGAENLSGWTTPPSTSYFVGSIDEVAVYGSALSASRVAAHYTAGTTA